MANSRGTQCSIASYAVTQAEAEVEFLVLFLVFAVPKSKFSLLLSFLGHVLQFLVPLVTQPRTDGNHAEELDQIHFMKKCLYHIRRDK
eukprot:CAMPEP_0172200984 /NCGR_PEP_ID=MMETSP1050-20130122/29692_1 /TAXON_ID=233186 /ORGANISM="Cryptomonas curvata, Strain CCAP979/52" /LENGTH=87 /DNA_ID=CAMNT_0012878469 /DNA_START=91 /DNA_END=354 /DNA_ORIENTATION=+